MPIITITHNGQKIHCNEGANLLRVLLSEDFFVDNPCNGKGTCGKCKVRIIEDNAVVLSCLTSVTNDISVELLHKKKKHRVLTEGYMPDFEKDEFDGGYGVAIDIGTTTVVSSLVSLADGGEIAQAAMINAQKHFGLDVLTRITYEFEHEDTGILDLQKAIVDSINDMIDEMCEKAAIDKQEIKEIVVAANCTMTHMLLGVDARPIGKAPYKPVFSDAQFLPAKKIGLRANDETMLYCLPQVSGYIGADIVAGAYVCKLKEAVDNILFIDIGTNGEIVLASNGRLLSCSCAAGPALEGMNITSGMRAADGAIEDVKITPSGITLSVIGDTAPEGLCGSGILAVVRELLKTEIVKSNGTFIKKEALPAEDYRFDRIRLNGAKREFVLTEDPLILITQSDVRQVQLAKGAILSGFVALLEHAGIKMQDLQKILIAGQFGAHLPADLLTGVGILPAEVEGKISYVGNSSKTGAYMALMSKKARAEIEALAKEMEYFELAETENYERIFTQSLTFPKSQP